MPQLPHGRCRLNGDLAAKPIGADASTLPRHRALRRGEANDFPAGAKERVIVLVSEETCQGDPAVAAKALAAKGITVHTVGFVVDSTARRRREGPKEMGASPGGERRPSTAMAGGESASGHACTSTPLQHAQSGRGSAGSFAYQQPRKVLIQISARWGPACFLAHSRNENARQRGGVLFLDSP